MKACLRLSLFLGETHKKTDNQPSLLYEANVRPGCHLSLGEGEVLRNALTVRFSPLPPRKTNVFFQLQSSQAWRSGLQLPLVLNYKPASLSPSERSPVTISYLKADEQYDRRVPPTTPEESNQRKCLLPPRDAQSHFLFPVPASPGYLDKFQSPVLLCRPSPSPSPTRVASTMPTPSAP